MNAHYEHDEVTPSQEYIKAFNEGYFIARYNSELSSKTVSINNSSEKGKAFTLGMMQVEIEKKLDKNNFSMFKTQSKSNTSQKKDKGKDHIDLEKE